MDPSACRYQDGPSAISKVRFHSLLVDAPQPASYRSGLITKDWPAWAFASIEVVEPAGTSPNSSTDKVSDGIGGRKGRFGLNAHCCSQV